MTTDSQVSEYQNPRRAPRGFSDHFAFGLVKLLRFFADLFFAKR